MHFLRFPQDQDLYNKKPEIQKEEAFGYYSIKHHLLSLNIIHLWSYKYGSGFFLFCTCVFVLQQKDKTTIETKIGKKWLRTIKKIKKKNSKKSFAILHLHNVLNTTKKNNKTWRRRRLLWLPSNYLPLHCVIFVHFFARFLFVRVCRSMNLNKRQLPKQQ